MTRRTGLVAVVTVMGALAVAFLALIGSAGAGKKSDGKQMLSVFEVPSVSSPNARGSIEVRITSPTTLSYELTYSGLSTDSLFAHIHFGQPFATGGVVTFLCGGGTKPAACPARAGTVEGTIGAADVQTVGAVGTPAHQGIVAGEIDEFMAAIRAGLTYANVHTQSSPQGELRGQIKARGGGDDDDD